MSQNVITNLKKYTNLSIVF